MTDTRLQQARTDWFIASEPDDDANAGATAHKAQRERGLM